jgi:hypothetical protein
MLKILLILFCFSVFADEIRIMATVNDDAITTVDVENRVRVLSLISPEFQKQGQKTQVSAALQNLIQASMKKSYIDRMNLILSDSELEKFVGNFLASGKYSKYRNFESIKNDDVALANFLRSEATWSKFVSMYIIPTIRVTKEEAENLRKTSKIMTEKEAYDGIFHRKLESTISEVMSKIRASVSIEIKNSQA